MSHDFTHLVSMSKESESKLRISWSLTGHKRGAFLNKKRLPVKKMYKIENSPQLKDDILHRTLEGWAKEEPEVTM